jgi:hypothetical protein
MQSETLSSSAGQQSVTFIGSPGSKATTTKTKTSAEPTKHFQFLFHKVGRYGCNSNDP